jgi:hypothetical protein
MRHRLRPSFASITPPRLKCKGDTGYTGSAASTPWDIGGDTPADASSQALCSGGGESLLEDCTQTTKSLRADGPDAYSVMKVGLTNAREAVTCR